MKTLTSSIKLNFDNVVTIQPWIILAILGEEFVSTDEDITGFAEVGQVRFGKQDCKIFQSDDRSTYFIQLTDGRTFSLTDLR